MIANKKWTEVSFPRYGGYREYLDDDGNKLYEDLETGTVHRQVKETILNQIMVSALDDGFISSNPLNSKRLRITGANSEATKPYSVEQMRYLVQHIEDIQNPMDRRILCTRAENCRKIAGSKTR